MELYKIHWKEYGGMSEAVSLFMFNQTFDTRFKVNVDHFILSSDMPRNLEDVGRGMEGGRKGGRRGEGRDIHVQKFPKIPD